MKFADNASIDDSTHGGGEIPPCAGLTLNALPEAQSGLPAESSQTGVSTRNALLGTDGSAPLKTIKRKPQKVLHWYALRVTYGREKKAYDYLVGMHVEAYYPTIKTVKDVDGKRKTVKESRIPNIFFARGTEEEIRSYVYDNVNLPYLRFYYSHRHVGRKIEKVPLEIPDDQIESLKIICAAEDSDIIVSLGSVPNFQTGQMVRVTEGIFNGVIGRVKRWQGQQRVGVIIGDMATYVTAYVPSAFLERMEETT